jgi:hypothetical protein
MENFSKSDSSIPNNKSKIQDKISLNKFLDMKQKSEHLVMQDNRSEADDDTWAQLDDLGGLDADDNKAQEQEGQEYGYDDDDESVISLDLNDVIEHLKLAHEDSTEDSTASVVEEEVVSQTMSLSLDDINPDLEDDDKDNEHTTEQVTAFAVVDPTGRRATYTGVISKSRGIPCGEGRMEYSDTGEIFEGQFVQGFWTGYGRCIYTTTGEDYTGFFLNNIKHGHGVTKYQDGRIFEGAYAHGVKAEGKMTYMDGSTYLGKWSHGVRHGRGTYTFPNGSVFFGEFQDDRMHGSGVLTWTNGSQCMGKWRNGVRHGPGKEFKADGSVRREGAWKDGRFIVVED